MDKPTIFFSHSTKDSPILQKLKKEVLDITGNTVNIFLSSDGQSIPLGKNWVSEIEEALDDASLMFVFISPNSIDSNWIHFEAGYGYSKGISVIIVAMNGIDIEQISPPLSLLQGFNLDGFKKLNNIIATINKHNKTTFPESFDKDSYEKIFSPLKGEHNNALIQRVIEEVIVFFGVQLLFEDIERILDKENIYYHKVNDNLYVSHGLQFELHNNALKITWSKFFEFEDVINQFAILKNKQSNHKQNQIRFVLKSGIGVKDDSKLVSESLQKEVEFTGQLIKYNNVAFSLFTTKNSKASIDIYPQTESIDFQSIMEVFNLLVNRNLIYTKSYGY